MPQDHRLLFAALTGHHAMKIAHHRSSVGKINPQTGPNSARNMLRFDVTYKQWAFGRILISSPLGMSIALTGGLRWLQRLFPANLTDH